MPRKREHFTCSLPWSTFPQITQIHSQTTQSVPVNEVEVERENTADEDMVDAGVTRPTGGGPILLESQLAAEYGGESFEELIQPRIHADDEIKKGVEALEAHKSNTVKAGRKKSPTKDQNIEEKEGGSCRWNEKSLKVLVDAKQFELRRLMDKRETKFHMLKAQSKWQHISDYVNSMGYNFSWKQCRDKWGAELTVYKRLSDYQNMSGKEDYFAMEPEARKSLGLPMDYSAEQFELLGTVLKDRANINPPGIGDSGKRRQKKNVAVSRASETEGGKEKEFAQSDAEEVSADDYTTEWGKKNTSWRKKKQKRVSSESEESEIQGVLGKFNDSFTDEMRKIFSSVMDKASDKQDANVEKMVKAAHDDVQSLMSVLGNVMKN